MDVRSRNKVGVKQSERECSSFLKKSKESSVIILTTPLKICALEMSDVALNTCCLRNDRIAVGSQDGTVTVYNTGTRQEEAYMRQSDAPILKVDWADEHTVWVSTGM